MNGNEKENLYESGSLRELIEKSRIETEVVEVEAAAATSAFESSAFSRRGFLATVSTGSLVLMGRISNGKNVRFADPQKEDAEAFSPDLFVSIDAEGTVHALCHRSEMGTGIRTGLPRVLADELEADWERVEIHQARGDRRLGDQNTDGSNSIRFFFKTMRTAGATARTMLERAAAKNWGVPAGECVAKDHQVVHSKTGRKTGFGDLVATARTLEVPKVGELKFKPREQWKYIGKDAPITDLNDILTGKAVFGIDARMENQLFAVIARPPVVGGTVKKVNTDAAKKVPGVVEIMEIPKFQGAPLFQPLGGVAVCATSTWAAWQGRDALEIEWELGPNSDYDTEEFARELKETVNQPGKTLRKEGDVSGEFEGKTTVAADYSVPHLSHAPMETTCAVADVKTQGNEVVSCHILTATQNPQAVQQAVGPAMGMKNDDVLVNVTLLGSGFGRKSKPDYCVEAAILSRSLKRPVHVTWTREDDLRHDYYHAISAVHCEASVDSKGRPTAWLQRVAYPTIASTFAAGASEPQAWEAEMGHTDLPFEVANLQLEVGSAPAKTRIGWLRSVCHIQQNFAVGSFADELAHAAGRDPYEFLLDLLGSDRKIDLKKAKLGNRGASALEYPYDIARLKNVLRRVGRNSDWENRKSGNGHGFGISCCRSFLGYTGHVVEVKVSKKGELDILKTWCSIDSGTIVSPDRVVAQVEGAAIMATSQVLFSEVTFRKGRTRQTNYDGFKVARMSDAPREIEVDVVPSKAAPAGVGETGVPSFAPALCNAVFAAIGKRIRDLPLSRHDLSWG
ncbi:MAG: molybdopterin cofactor-binding domain-containing protein [Planctomycetota bacterium]|nr:molybdopterin cofactor-binding domain-containing protein [Planctomycetota bacterium]